MLKIISVKQYKEFMPDIFEQAISDKTIQSAINQSELEINSLCGGKVSIAMNETDPTKPYFLTPEKRDYLDQAMLLETQHVLNSNLDFSLGNVSITQGGTSYSDNRPQRERVPQSVKNMLTLAGVFEIQNYTETSIYGDKDSNSVDGEGSLNDENQFITFLNGDKRYILNYQPQIPSGMVPFVNENKVINWKNISEEVESAKMILDIDDYKYKYGSNLLKWQNYYTKAEMKTIINEFQNARVWKADISYFQFQGCIATYSTNEKSVKFEPGKTYQFYSLVSNNLGNNPFTSPEFWAQISMDIDYDLLHLWIKTEVGVEVPIEVEKYMSQLAQAQAPFSVGTFVDSQADPSNTSFEYFTLPVNSNRYYSLTEAEKIRYPQLTEWLAGEPIDRMEYGTSFFEDVYVDNLLQTKKITKSDNTPYSQVGLNEVLNKTQLEQKFNEYDDVMTTDFLFITEKEKIEFRGYYVKQKSGLIIFNLYFFNGTNLNFGIDLKLFPLIKFKLSYNCNLTCGSKMEPGQLFQVQPFGSEIIIKTPIDTKYFLTIIGRWK